VVVRDLPGQNCEFSQPIELRMNELIAGVRGDLAVKIYGDDLGVLLQYANRIAEELKTVPGAQDLKIEQRRHGHVIAIPQVRPLHHHYTRVA
jgi:cobalt-zinc-cadmium resistance protein CzcA